MTEKPVEKVISAKILCRGLSATEATRKAILFCFTCSKGNHSQRVEEEGGQTRQNRYTVMPGSQLGKLHNSPNAQPSCPLI